MTEHTDTMADLTDRAYMQIYRASYHHVPRVAARLDQDAIGTGYAPRGGTPGSSTAKHAAERARRGLTYPESWIEAGLIAPAGE